MPRKRIKVVSLNQVECDGKSYPPDGKPWMCEHKHYGTLLEVGAIAPYVAPVDLDVVDKVGDAEDFLQAARSAAFVAIQEKDAADIAATEKGTDAAQKKLDAAVTAMNKACVTVEEAETALEKAKASLDK